MREGIGKYRGKALEDGEWVYGCFWKFDDDYRCVFIRHFAGEVIYDTEVDPETVGEFTGKRDKEGVDVYEGDLAINKYGRICVIVWHEPTASFDAKFHEDTEFRPDVDMSDGFAANDWETSITVIGKLHDETEQA